MSLAFIVRWSLSPKSTEYSRGAGPPPPFPVRRGADCDTLPPSDVYTFGGSTLPSTMIVALHFRQRIFARRSWTFSSAMEYLAPQEGQESFTATLRRRPPGV